MTQEKIKTTIGKNVKRLRALSGLTIDQCAERSGITSHAFSDIERGHRNPRASTLLGLSTCFNVTVDSLYYTK